jgi:activating signal cointegrator complex subunit 1
MSQITIVAENGLRDQQLRGLIRAAIAFSQLLRVQKAGFSVKLPSGAADDGPLLFDEETMEDIGDDIEEAEHEGGMPVVTCSVSPTVLKEGDEKGEETHLRNIIARANVICRSG